MKQITIRKGENPRRMQVIVGDVEFFVQEKEKNRAYLQYKKIGRGYRWKTYGISGSFEKICSNLLKLIQEV